MFTAKRRGFIALLAALLLAALIAFGISMLPAASRTVPVSAEQETIEVDSDTSLQEAFNQAVTAGGGTVTLTQDITLDEYVLINYDTEKDDGSALSGNPKINFDLNGHVITISQTVTTIFIMENKPSDKEAGGAILRVYGATLNVTDSNSTAEHQEEKISVGGGIDGSNATNADDKATEINLFTVQAGGLLTFNGGTYIMNDDSGACAYAFKGSDAASDGKIEIRGGSFINESTLDYTYGGGTVLVINQGNIDRSLIEISGGTFSGRNPAFGDDNKGGTFIADNAKAVTYTTGTGDTKETYIAVGGASQEDSTLVPEGATIVASDSFKTIGEEAVLVNTVYDIEALNSVLQNVAKTAYISLGKDITGSVEIPSGKTVTLDLNGHNLTGGESHAITNNGTLTVIGEGTVTAAASGKAAVYNAQGATATLNGGTYTRTADYSWYVIYNDGIMTLDGITAENKNSSHTASLITNSEDVNETGNVKATLTINSGTYFSQGSNAVKNDEGGSLIITGGEITSKSYSGYYGILSYGDLNISGNPTVYGQRNPLGISRAIDSTDTAEVTISGGTFETPHVSLGVVITIISPEGGQGKLDFTINGGKFDCAEGRTLLGQSIEAQLNQGDCAIDITSGAFSGKIVIDSKITTTISGGTFDTNVTKYLAEGLMQTADGVVIENDTAVAQVGDSVYSTLQAAIDAAIDGATITLLADSVSGNRLEISGKTVTIALNGYNITRENAKGTAIRVGYNAALTVIGEGKIDAGNYGPFTVQTSAQGTGRLTVKGGTYSQRIPAEWLEDGFALINNAEGDFEVTEGETEASIASGQYTYIFTTLRAAVIAAEDGDTVVLEKDITVEMTTALSTDYIGNKSVTIDLNGKTISSNNDGYVIGGTLSKSITITSSNGLGRIVLNGGRALGITAADVGTDINVNISNIIISGTSNNFSPIVIDGSNKEDSVFVEMDNVTVDILNGKNGAKIAVEVDGATVVMRDCHISIANVDSVTATQNTIAASFKNSDVVIIDSTLISADGAAALFYGSLSVEEAIRGNSFGYKTLNIKGSVLDGYTFAISGNASNTLGDENTERSTYHGTIINIEGSKLSGTIGAGIFHPQVGILNILGNGNVISGTSGIEMRGGSLNIEGGVFTATSIALDISDNPGSGSTIDGAAIVVSQHGYDPAIQVSIAGGVFNGLYALYEDDLVNEEGTEDIQISVSGGMYNGEVYSQNKSGFVTGGTFAALDGEYIAPGYAFDEATGTVVSATLNNNALADVRAYLAAYGLLYGDIKDLAAAETPDALAQAIVDAYEAIAAATGEEAIAVAKMDALDAIDEFIDNLNTAKAEAIAELEELIMEPVDVTEGGEVIKEAVVAMPTYIVSAINGAKSAAEVEKYVAVATAEINELIDMREQAADDQLALENQLNSIISALGIVQQAGGSWSSSFLAGIEESVNTAKDNILTISSLLGRPTDEATAETIFGKLEEANANIQGVYDKLSAEISAMLTGEGGISSQLEELKGLVDENSALAADIDNVLATAGRIEGALGNINSNNTLSNVLEQMNNLVSDYQSTVTNAILNIRTRLDQLQQNMPTDSTIANALRSVIAGVENDLDMLKAEVDALDEPNGALVTAINEKIEAAFESFGNTFTSELDKLNGTIAGLDTAIDNLPETLDIEGIKQAIADAKSAAEAAGAKVDALTAADGALTTIDGKIDAIDGVVDGIADAQESMGNALTTFATATDTALKGIQSDIDGLESKLNAMANTAATDKADILAKIAELKSAADDISEAIASLDGDSAEDLSGIAEDLAALQTALDGVKADIGNVSQQVGGVAEDNTNSMSNFAGLYLFLSALVVLAIAILIVVSVKKRR